MITPRIITPISTDGIFKDSIPGMTNLVVDLRKRTAASEVLSHLGIGKFGHLNVEAEFGAPVMV